MARRLAVTVLIIALSGASVISRAQTQTGSPPTSAPSANSNTTTNTSANPGQSKSLDDKPTGNKPTGDKPTGDKPHPADRPGGEFRTGENRGDRRDGDRRERDESRGGERRFGARSLMEAVRRDGGPLELAPILLSKHAISELKLDESVKTDVENFFQDLQKKWEEERKAENAANAPRQLSIQERVAEVSSSFKQLLQKLTPEEQERVLGAFVQWRKYRSLSNRIIAVDKLGMTSEEANELRQTIDTIRDEVLNESRDKFRQLWESGRDRSEAEQLMHKNREKIDERIKAKLTSEQIEKLERLRGQSISEETLKSLDTPPSPPPRPR